MPLHGLPKSGGRKGPATQRSTAQRTPSPGRPQTAGGHKGGGVQKSLRGPALESETNSKNHGPGTSGTGAGPGRGDLLTAMQEAANKVARADEDKGGDSKGPITFSTHDMQYYGYMERLKEKIEGVWVYPREAIEKRLYGALEIQFTILKNGSLGDIRVVRTSGYPLLDEAALKALKDGQPYWPLPDEWGKKSFTVDGHFLYTFMGGEIR